MCGREVFFAIHSKSREKKVFGFYYFSFSLNAWQFISRSVKIVFFFKRSHIIRFTTQHKSMNNVIIYWYVSCIRCALWLKWIFEWQQIIRTMCSRFFKCFVINSVWHHCFCNMHLFGFAATHTAHQLNCLESKSTYNQAKIRSTHIHDTKMRQRPLMRRNECTIQTDDWFYRALFNACVVCVCAFVMIWSSWHGFNFHNVQC